MPDFPPCVPVLSDRARIPSTTEFSGKGRLNDFQKNATSHNIKGTFINLRDTCQNVSDKLQGLIKKQGVHSSTTMISAGLPYTNNGDAARCNICRLEVSGWTSEMDPFTIHKQRSPTCSFIRSMLPSEKISTDSAIERTQTTSKSNVAKEVWDRLKTDTPAATPLPKVFVEVDSLKQIRKRTFSHWPHQSSPSATQMMQAGFFSCNVGDRAICIYCNVICQQWTPGSDDPCEVHKTLSPKCPYVMFILSAPSSSAISVINEASASVDSFPSQAIVSTAACNPNYSEIPKRLASFATWSNENFPAIDDLVKAGFFFTGTKTIVTCFYCNGSLQNWGANDDPMIEHARWFPHCAYARQLCGAELYRKIQESKRAQQERARDNNVDSRAGTGASNLNHGRLVIPDESTLSRFVAARLDLPISQSLLDRGFKLSIIKRCWEDQLRLKHDDFASDSDLLMACMILQKQIECINGRKENIIVPSVAMNRIREQEQAEAHAHEQTTLEPISANSTMRADVKMTVLPESAVSKTRATAAASNGEEMKSLTPFSAEKTSANEGNGSSLANPCVVCLKEEKRLACIPCGHLVTCASCGQSLRSCPTCHRSIDAFVRVYL